MIPKSPQISQSAGMRRDDICLYVSPANRSRLEAIIKDRNSSRKSVWRAEIVLATGDGAGTNAIMRRTGKSKPCVWRWQERFVEEGVDGLMRDKTRPSRIPALSEEVKRAVLTKTAKETPANATHWSLTSMAAATGISPSSVGRIWREAGLKPHRVDTFKVSNDPHFEEKVADVVGLYMRPPDDIDPLSSYHAGSFAIDPQSPRLLAYRLRQPSERETNPGSAISDHGGATNPACEVFTSCPIHDWPPGTRSRQ